jgi:hypothetical protein
MVDRIEQLQEQFRDAGAADPALTPEAAAPEVAGNETLCPNINCRYKGAGKWMRAQGNNAGNGIVAVMTGVFIILGMVLGGAKYPVMLSLVLFFSIPAKYRKMSWQDIQKEFGGKGRLIACVSVFGVILLLSSGFFFWLLLSLAMLILILWGIGKTQTGSSVELCCPKCRTPWGVYPRRAAQDGTRKLP